MYLMFVPETIKISYSCTLPGNPKGILCKGQLYWVACTSLHLWTLKGRGHLYLSYFTVVTCNKRGEGTLLKMLWYGGMDMGWGWGVLDIHNLIFTVITWNRRGHTYIHTQIHISMCNIHQHILYIHSQWTMLYDDALRAFGDFGRYQYFIVVYCGISSASVAMSVYAFVFIISTGNYWCKVSIGL